VTERPAAPLRIVIADDQASVREGLVLLLGMLPDIEVVGAGADGQQALDLVAEHDPDVILLDLHMPVLDGIQATRTLTAEHPEVAIVILTTYADDSSVMSALRAGVRSSRPVGHGPRSPGHPGRRGRRHRRQHATRGRNP
jgi:DNA-binding NarL/FixJ family response regulator